MTITEEDEEQFADPDNWPYCMCGEEPDEEEEAMNCCKACGKPIE